MPCPQLGLSPVSRTRSCHSPLQYVLEAMDLTHESANHGWADRGHLRGVCRAAWETEIQIHREVVCELSQ